MFSIEELGFTKEQLFDKVVDKCVSTLLLDAYAGDGESDDEDGTYKQPSPFQKAMQKRIAAKIDEAVDNIAARNVIPKIEGYLEGFVIQQTNQWGEPKAPPITLVEALMKRADAYMQEPVNYEGKARGENFDSFTPKGTRLTYHIEKYFHHHLQQAMQKIVGAANQHIAGGIGKAVQANLAEILAGMKMDLKITTPR